jgi:hypothetical protein
MIEYWVYVYQDFLEGWETYDVYLTREEALSVINLLTKWKKKCKIITTYDF